MTEANIPGGFIIIARKIVESEIWDKPPLYLKVWIYLLLIAQHKDFKGLKRGQVSTSIPKIIEAISWKVGARRERPTRDQVFQIIDWMRKTKPQRSPYESNARATMITTAKATQSLVITIDNYWDYQDIKNYESNDEGNNEKATKPPRKQRQPDNINKNVKNDNKYIAQFEEFWSIYPSKKGKAKALIKWMILSPDMDFEKVIEGTKAYIAFIEHGIASGKNREFKDGSTFVNHESWKDVWTLPPERDFRPSNKSPSEFKPVLVSDDERRFLQDVDAKATERNRIPRASNE